MEANAGDAKQRAVEAVRRWRERRKLDDPWAIKPKTYVLQMVSFVLMMLVFAIGIATGVM